MNVVNFPRPGNGDGNDFLRELRKLIGEWNAAVTRAEAIEVRRARSVRHYLWLTIANAVMWGLNLLTLVALVIVKLL